MSQREETIDAGIEALKKYGTGACAAQVIGGYLDMHKQLEREISAFVGQEDCILFSSGFGANAGVLRALLGKNDIALVDSYIHTSAMAGLIGTNIKRIGHNDLVYLEKVLNDVKEKFQTKLVIIDGVYSQDGDLSELPHIIALCRKYGAMLMVDDAHGIGVMGENGRGTVEHFGCLGQVDIITGTFSKSFGCVGGFVLASKKIIQYLRYYADSNVFSAAPTPQVTASVLKALELLKEQQGIRKKLWENTDYLRKRLLEKGFDIGKSVSPIFPIMIRDNKKVYEVAKMLLEKGIFTIAIVYPAVRTKEARLRVSVLATHEKQHLDSLVSALEDIDKVIKMIKNKRKRRTKEEVVQNIMSAANNIIAEKGFLGLTATGLMKDSDIEPVQFYKRYSDLAEFIDDYVKKYDYWFSDTTKLQVDGENYREEYKQILSNLFLSLLDNKVMQQLLSWELSVNNETSRRTAGMRELHTLPLAERFDKIFEKSDVDIVALSSLIIGGIYYLTLHKNLANFSGIDVNTESGRERILKTIRFLGDLFFERLPE